MSAAVLLLLAGVAVILVTIAVNGYFVAQEFAYMSVDRNRLAARARDGDAAAERALKVTNRTSFMLSGAQLGITVTGLLVGYVAEPMVAAPLATLLGGSGLPEGTVIALATVGVLVVATLVQMLFGELYPKNLAIASSEPMARWLARSTLIYLSVFGWLIAFFDKSANLLLRAVGIEPIHDLDTSATAEDLGRIVADSRDSGDLPVELSVLLDRILDFPDQDVEHAMVPRGRVDTVAAGMSVSDVRALMATAHTRYPVLDAEGQPVGVVQLQDILRLPADSGAPVATIMREPVIVPTLMPLPAALTELDEAGMQMACVVDEYGGFAGVLTMEDLAEELVGEITDEHDTEVPEQIVAGEDDQWLMDGDVHVDEVERALGHRLPDGDFETISGLLIAQTGDLPEVGQVVSVELPQDPAELVSDEPVTRSLAVEVLKVERHVPSEVSVRLLTRPADGRGPEPQDESTPTESAPTEATPTESAPTESAPTEEEQR